MTRVKKWLVLCAVLAGSGFGAAWWAAPVGGTERAGKGTNKDGEHWHLLVTGKMAAVHVERALYELPGNTGFYTATRVTNRTGKPLGVDLRKRYDAIHVNQWGAHDQPRRGDINERRVIRKPLNQAGEAWLRAGFHAGKLAVIPPGKSLVFYARFNNHHGRKEVEANKGKYLILSMDGVVSLTDGKQSEQISCSWDERGVGGTDVTLARPHPWKAIPARALVLRD
jgi:hypothetical protein